VQSITSDVNGLDVNNSIIRNSSGNPISGLVNTSFSNISYLNNTINGNFDANPHFVDPGNDDFHLKSTTAHYDNSIGGWTFDLYDCSTSINAGNPSITCKEPDGGPIVNIGAYGNTDQASHLCSSKSVNVYGSDSIDKHGDGSVSIYPNPVIDKLTIELELECESYVKIYLSDLSGKQIAFIAQDICKSGKNLFNYSVEDYDQLKYGVYLLTVETNDSFFSEKVVINK
jgi:hypothetical protein